MVRKKILNFLSKVGGCPPNIAKRRTISALGMGLGLDARAMLKLKNKHIGKRAFVIGNGPSLKIGDLNILKENNEITFASNKIHLAFDQTDWRPSYHVLENDIVVKELADVIPKWKHQTLLSYDALAHMPRYDNILYFTRDFHTNPVHPNFQKCPLGHVHMGYTVLYSCLQFAFFFGIREIYLLGVDFNYTFSSSKEDRKIGTTQKYVSEGEGNHFHPDYKTPGEVYYDPNLEYQGIAFAKAKNVYKQSGGKILNATRGGQLEVYPRVDFDSLF